MCNSSSRLQFLQSFANHSYISHSNNLRHAKSNEEEYDEQNGKNWKAGSFN